MGNSKPGELYVNQRPNQYAELDQALFRGFLITQTSQSGPRWLWKLLGFVLCQYIYTASGMLRFCFFDSLDSFKHPVEFPLWRQLNILLSEKIFDLHLCSQLCA